MWWWLVCVCAAPVRAVPCCGEPGGRATKVRCPSKSPTGQCWAVSRQPCGSNAAHWRGGVWMCVCVWVRGGGAAARRQAHRGQHRSRRHVPHPKPHCRTASTAAPSRRRMMALCTHWFAPRVRARVANDGIACALTAVHALSCRRAPCLTLPIRPPVCPTRVLGACLSPPPLTRRPRV